MTTDIITATARCELVKPLGMSWDDLGITLRALQAPLHRVLNNTITELELLRGQKDLHEIETKHPQTVSYQMINKYWKQEREAAAARVEKGKPWYMDDAIATVEPGSRVALGTAGLVYARWQKFAKERYRGDSSLPSFKQNPPITVASSSGAVQLRAEDGLFVLSLSLLAGRTGRVELVIRPYGPSVFADIRRAAEDPEMLGDCKILRKYDRKAKKKKWMVMLAVKRPVTKITAPRVMSIHRGVNTFLTAAIAGHDGKEAFTTRLQTGDDIVEHKRGYEARRRSLGQQQRQIGSGARGHGEARRREATDKLEDSEANWVRTKCQQAAAQVVKLAQQRNVGEILLEDWGNPLADKTGEDSFLERLVRSFPMAQLKECIAWASRNVGISIREVGTSGHARRCPACRHENAGDASTFLCGACQFERDRDVVFAWNMLIDAGEESPVADSKKALRRTAGRIKRSRATSNPAEAGK